jgi:hypothetical protein
MKTKFWKMSGLLVTAMVTVNVWACPPPDPQNNNGGNTGDHNAQDPVFLLSEKKPVMSAGEKLGQISQQGSVTRGVSGEAEKAVLAEYETARKQGGGQVYGKVLDIWGREVSPEVKQYAILSSLPVVKTTDEVQTLKFMLSALENVDARVAELTAMAKGNGLEKAKAARLMEVLSRNPQFKI